MNFICDTDLYKLTMMQIILAKYPTAMVEYEYKLRSNVDLSNDVVAIQETLDRWTAYSRIGFSQYELKYLKTLPFIKPFFIEYLKAFKGCSNEDYRVWVDENKEIRISIKGSWLNTILFELGFLPKISQYWGLRELKKHNDNIFMPLGVRDRLQEKINLIKDYNDPTFQIIEFGTRRRLNKMVQCEVIEQFIKQIPQNLAGTSNIQLACKYKIPVIGTMAHEYLQAYQSFEKHNLKNFQYRALYDWITFYDGQLGIALTDCINDDAFLEDFYFWLASRYRGVRHDSGDPYVWAERYIKHYEKLGINPQNKTLVFSDSLTVPKAIDLHKTFKKYINTSFGIGTDLTFDCENVKALSQVIKLTKVNDNPVAKLSNNPSKTMCKDEEYLSTLKKTFNY